LSAIKARRQGLEQEGRSTFKASGKVEDIRDSRSAARREDGDVEEIKRRGRGMLLSFCEHVSLVIETSLCFSRSSRYRAPLADAHDTAENPRLLFVSIWELNVPPTNLTGREMHH
jgi:hypothetical protein